MKRSEKQNCRRLRVEPLETRCLLSVSVGCDPIVLRGASFTPLPPAGAFTPAEMRARYDVTGDGAGQTIGIVDVGWDPTIFSDVAVFDATFGLPQFSCGVPHVNPVQPSFTIVNQQGQLAPMPAAQAQNIGTSLETALDVEWAHSIAPKANIVLVETNLGATQASLIANFIQGAATAAFMNASVVSMSYGWTEKTTPANVTAAEEAAGDAIFKSFPGVTFTASTGDSGSNPANGGGPAYPSTSPFVLAVGGTTLNANGTETGWSGSGGGASAFEAKPAWQVGVNIAGAKRLVPDVAMDANPASGVAVYSVLDGGWIQVGGTSLSSPMWAGVTAIINQGRAAQDRGPVGQALMPDLYGLYAGGPASALYLNNFHDITVGNNGLFACAAGYDEVTGLGSPKTPNLVPTVIPLAFATMTVDSTQTTAQKEAVVDQFFTEYALD
jgi:subtilase family serine protease